MTERPSAPPAAASPEETAVSPNAAAALLRQAEQVAEQLRLEAEAEARALTESLRTDSAEARRRREQATRVLQVAERQLDEAAQESKQIIADAGEQASTLIRAAG